MLDLNRSQVETDKCRQGFMELHLFLALVSLVLFSVCARSLIGSLKTPIPALNFSEYSKLALKVKKAYKISAWGIMTMSFLSLLAISWLQIFEII